MCCFFFKRKTAYELRISDWSSDVCSSDLSRTQGVDAVLTVGFDLGGGKATLGLNGNYTKTDVIKASPVITADRERLLELEGFVPKWKGNASFTHAGGRFGFVARANYYGQWTDYGPGRKGVVEVKEG